MKLGNLDIIGDPATQGVGLTLTLSGAVVDGDPVFVTLNPEQFERLITYLKGLRDGAGWNHKAHADRSL